MGNPSYFTAISQGRKSLNVAAVLIVFFSALAQFASFALIQNYVVGAFGAQPEEVSVALQAAYIGVLAGLPLQMRLQQYFHTRAYLLATLMVGVLINLGCLAANDMVVFTILRFLQGITTVIIAGNMLSILLTVFPPQKAMVLGSYIFFGFILASGVMVGIAAAWIVLRTDWKAIYYFLIGLQMLSMVVCLLFFNARSLARRYPLYQFDWLGSAIFIGWAFAFLYVVVYGPKRYWFNDPSILYASVAGLFLFVAFVYRQLRLKRPLLHLEVFKYKKFIIGIVLLAIFYGSKDSLNLIYGYTGGILGWHTSDLILLGCWNVFGVFSGSALGIFAIMKDKTNVPKLILFGLFVMLVYHLIVYTMMSSSLSFNNLVTPVLLQGIASGLLFVPIILMCLSTLPPAISATGVVLCAYVRFVTTINGITGYYNLQLNYSQLYKESFLGHLTSTDFEFAQRITAYRNLLLSKGFYGEQNQAMVNAFVAKTVAVQSQLLAIKTTFLTIGAILAVAIVLLLVFVIVSKRNAQPKTA